MEYFADFSFTPTNASEFYKVVKLEEAEKDRSGIRIKKEKDKIIFHINSKDTTALKASVNLILKIITIYEKTESLKNG